VSIENAKAISYLIIHVNQCLAHLFNIPHNPQNTILVLNYWH